MYGYDEADGYATMGEADFQTVGYDEMGQAVVMPRGAAPPGGRPPVMNRTARAAPGPRLPPGGMAAPMQAFRPAMSLPFNRGFAITPQQAAALTEAQVRALINEELNARLPSWFQGASRVPGSSDAAQLMSPLGLGVGLLTPAVSSVILTAQPQRPFRGERLLVDLARSTGAATVPVRISEFKIGENSQLVGAGALPADAFDPAAFGVRLAMSPSAPGINILLRVETDVGAIPAGESISVTAAIIGRAVWGEAGGPG